MTGGVKWTFTDSAASGNIQDNGRLVLHDVYFIPPDYTPEKELAEIAKEFQCSLFDDLTIRLEDIFERVK